MTTRRVALLVVTAALAATTGGCTSYSGETWIGDDIGRVWDEPEPPDPADSPAAEESR